MFPRAIIIIIIIIVVVVILHIYVFKKFKAQFYTVNGAIKFQGTIKFYTSCTLPYDCMGYLQ